jgi:VIT1/CCC1 family predicted Fe2+/Mn2+ transporter
MYSHLLWYDPSNFEYVVGGFVRSEGSARSHWLILACSFVGAAACALFALVLIVQAAFGHGSHAGNILRVALAIIFLFLALFLIAIGTLHRMSFDDDQS